MIYRMALAYKDQGDTATAKEFARKAAHPSVLPQIAYAFVRGEAGRV